jgi:hypothetical protein
VNDQRSHEQREVVVLDEEERGQGYGEEPGGPGAGILDVDNVGEHDNELRKRTKHLRHRHGCVRQQKWGGDHQADEEGRRKNPVLTQQAQEDGDARKTEEHERHRASPEPGGHVAAKCEKERHQIERLTGRPVSLRPEIGEQSIDLAGDQQVIVQPSVTEVGCQVPARKQPPRANHFDGLLRDAVHDVNRGRDRQEPEELSTARHSRCPGDAISALDYSCQVRPASGGRTMYGSPLLETSKAFDLPRGMLSDRQSGPARCFASRTIWPTCAA